MARWILKPLVISFGTLLLVYVVLVNQNGGDLTVLPRFNRFNAFDSGQEAELQSDNVSANAEVLLLDHPQKELAKIIDNARAECHDNLLQEKTDIRISGQSITYDPNFVSPISSDDILNVHLIFHSHIDPGWLMTFDQYYDQKVKYILENAINFLAKYNDARFIWSEMSYLHYFYTKSTPGIQEKLKKLIENGQFELCGGAWVMTDEATPYFWATIDNIIEGQRFILDEFNASAESSWSVDPFGHGASTPYLLSLTEIQNLVVGRLDKHLKENMAEKGVLLFNMAQPWNTGLERDLPLISSLPRTYYTTTDACGPDSMVCCQFDFGNSRSMCGERAHLTRESIAKFAKMLAGQYSQLQPFYRNKHLLIAIGDDFFFSEPRDFTENYRNYRLLIEHINSNPQFKMNIKFSTVSEYFKGLRSNNQNHEYPILRGDFFPYTENREGSHPYWTGYFVHRPNFKRLERIIQGKLRRLDISRVLLGRIDNYDMLQIHRRNLALVQHHDAITGTSKPHVMQDYLTRLMDADKAFKQLESDVFGSLNYVNFLGGGKLLEFNANTKTQHLTIFNQRTSTEFQRISVFVNKPNVAVKSSDETLIESQLFPRMNLMDWTPNESVFELIFYIRVPALGTRQITLYLSSESTQALKIQGNKNANITQPLNDEENVAENLENPEKEGFLVDCGNFSLRFDDNGLLKSVRRDDNNDEEVKLRLQYGYYVDYGGAYVFAPSGHQKTATLKDSSLEPTVVMGTETIRIYSKLQFSDPSKYELYQFIEIPRKQSSKSIEIRVELISSPIHLDGMTFVMNLETDIENNNAIFTDINGLYLSRREMNDGVLHAGNFYPVASSALIEDHAERVTVLFAQPTGATTSSRGHLEFFIDRNVKTSDGKGLDYGDSATNETTNLHYRIIVEKRDVSHAHKTIYLSRHSHDTLEELLHPSSVFETRNSKALSGVLWPCNVQLINIRHLPKPSGTILLILRRLDFDCTIMDSNCVNSNDKLLFTTLKQMFPGKRMRFTSLTGAQDGLEITNETMLNERLKPFQIISIKYE